MRKHEQVCGTRSLARMILVYALLGLFCGAAFFSAVYCGMSNPEKKYGRTAINETVVGPGDLLGAQSFAILTVYYPMGMYTPWAIMALLALQWSVLRVGRKRFL